LVCKKDYKNFTQTGSALACSDTSIALNSVTVTKVKDCQSTVVYNSTSGTDSFGCYYCDKGKAPSGTWSATTWVGSPGACTNYTGIANCDYPNKTASNTYNCVACKSKFAVANNSASWVSNTIISVRSSFVWVVTISNSSIICTSSW
jgi:hypothetical protein